MQKYYFYIFGQHQMNVHGSDWPFLALFSCRQRNGRVISSKNSCLMIHPKCNWYFLPFSQLCLLLLELQWGLFFKRLAILMITSINNFVTSLISHGYGSSLIMSCNCQLVDSVWTTIWPIKPPLWYLTYKIAKKQECSVWSVEWIFYLFLPFPSM